MLGNLAATLRAGALLLPLSLVAACGDSSGTFVAEPDRPSELVFTKPDGSTITLTPESAECGPSDYDPDVQVVRLQHGTRQGDAPGHAGSFGGVKIEVVPADVSRGATFNLPVTAGDMESGPANAFLFYGSDDFEVSTVEEETTGTLEVTEASCAPVRLQLTIDATLASEYYDGEALSVTGQLDLRG